jgi:hypothetical protein
VWVGADFPYDSNHDGVADRNECNPNNGTVCDCNTSYAANCIWENPEFSESQEATCVSNGYPGAPYDSAVHPGAIEQCDGKDNDCNPQTSASGGEADVDHDGYFAGCGLDCNDNDALINPGVSEGMMNVWTCFDGIDNDCDGVVDTDCAIDILPGSQSVTPGSVVVGGSCGTGTESALSSSSLNNTYECLKETKIHGNYTLTALWTFSTLGMPTGTDYELRVDGYRNTGDNDGFNFSVAVKQGPTSPFCTNADVGTASTIVSITDFQPDPNKLQSADVGVDKDKVCVRLTDSNASSDPSIQDTLTLDRVYLFPAPVAVGDYLPLCDVAGPGALCDVGTLAEQTSYKSTARSDDFREGLSEEQSGGNFRVWHTWQFMNVPAGSGHKLHFEGNRMCAPDPCSLDDFKFYYSTDPATWSLTDPLAGFTAISGATINTTADSVGGLDSASFGGSALSGMFYIRVIDAQNTGSSGSQNTLSVDHLTIRTIP